MHPYVIGVSGAGAGIVGTFATIRFFTVRRRQKEFEALASHAQQDHAIQQLSEDILDRGPLVTSLARALVRSEVDGTGRVTSRRSTGFVIGLTGPWGAGKSSVVNLLREQLRGQKGVVVAYLNPWLFRDRDDLLKAYFNSLRDAMGRSTDENVRALLSYLERYRKAINWIGTASAAMLDGHGLGGRPLSSGFIFRRY